MPQFFIKSSNITANKCIIEGKDYHHLKKVRRAKPGDFVDLRSDDGIIYKGIINELNTTSIVVEIVATGITKDLPVELNLYAGFLKGKKFDLVVQKAAEIGVNRIVPVITERTIPVISNNENKKSRWGKIVKEASKQCMRKDIPVIEEMITFEEAVTNCQSEIKIIAHPYEGSRNIREYFTGKNNVKEISVLIGPEGGFTDKELESAKKNNWGRLTFGFTALRAETASIVLPAVILYEWSNISEVKG